MTAHERHFFRAVEHGKVVNYFRVDVKAHASFSSARYLSGYFDEAAVDTYFATFTQPSSFPGAAPSKGKAEGGAEETVEGGGEKGGEKDCVITPVDPCLAGKKLVMLLSSNSDEVASQIGTFADGQEASGLLGRLVSSRRGAEGQAAGNDLDLLRRQANLLASAGDTILARLQGEGDVVEFANRVAIALGSTRTFFEASEARTWLAEQLRELGRR
jgi:hypothetical protein